MTARSRPGLLDGAAAGSLRHGHGGWHGARTARHSRDGRPRAAAAHPPAAHPGASAALPGRAGAAPVQWLLLPASVAGDCLSLVVAAAPPNAAIGDVAIYSELDGPAGLAAIAAQVAGSEGSRGEGAARTLLLRARRDAAGRQAVLAAVTTAQGSAANSRPDGLRRLDELLLQLAEAEAPTRDPLAAPPPTALDALLAQVVTRHVSGSSASDEEAAAFLASLVSYPRVGARLLQRISDDRSLRSSVRGQALAHWAGLVFATAPAEAATAVLSRLPEATTERGLAPGVHAALVTVASCTPPSEPALLAVLATLDAQLAAATAPGSANEPAALSGLTLVLSAVSGAQARCPDSPRTQSWPTASRRAGRRLPKIRRLRSGRRRSCCATACCKR